jgi:hypothetical protein
MADLSSFDLSMMDTTAPDVCQLPAFEEILPTSTEIPTSTSHMDAVCTVSPPACPAPTETPAADGSCVLLLPPAEFEALVRASPELSREQLQVLRRDRRRALNRAYQQKSRARRAGRLEAAPKVLSRTQQFALEVRQLAQRHVGAFVEGQQFIAALEELTANLLEKEWARKKEKSIEKKNPLP